MKRTGGCVEDRSVEDWRLCGGPEAMWRTKDQVKDCSLEAVEDRRLMGQNEDV